MKFIKQKIMTVFTNMLESNISSNFKNLLSRISKVHATALKVKESYQKNQKLNISVIVYYNF